MRTPRGRVSGRQRVSSAGHRLPQRQPAVQWYDPIQLLQTGVRVVLSAVFGAYADRREVQGAFPITKEFKCPDDEMWFDYVADVGDGWDATHSIARVLAEPELTILSGGSTDSEYRLPRGCVLVFGGDEVYPTAGRAAYEDRLRLPYETALPRVDENYPHLFALPGNHDWYDGLTSFLRMFCQGGWVGAWKTEQERSYFAIELPHRWWLWGVDMQFDTYVDKPQLDYFRDIANRRMSRGDRVILCTSKPSWVNADHDPSSLSNLNFFCKETFQKVGTTSPVILTGDLHHYCRYERASDGQVLITSGGGGAYLSPTHHMPEEIALETADATLSGEYQRKVTFPDAKTSLRLAWGAWRLPLRNPRFIAVAGAMGLPLAAILVRARGVQGRERRSFPRAVVGDRGQLLPVAAVLVSFGALANGSPPKRMVSTGLHLLAQGALYVKVLGFTEALFGGEGDGDRLGTRRRATLAAGLAAFPSSMMIGLYLATSQAILGRRGAPRHANETFAVQRIESYKNFLRLHITREGALEIFPIGLRAIASRGRALSSPRRSAREDRTRPTLIEPPVII